MIPISTLYNKFLLLFLKGEQGQDFHHKWLEHTKYIKVFLDTGNRPCRFAMLERWNKSQVRHTLPHFIICRIFPNHSVRRKIQMSLASWHDKIKEIEKIFLGICIRRSLEMHAKVLERESYVKVLWKTAEFLESLLSTRLCVHKVKL